ncbi:MAG: Asp-tRNA(Asn)/Glu-tRNA(Gln) amidotransferase subunit GatC [Planctomycetota bacterium]|nr:MAG: Asp-tRNA(Asn)/Glu-tRNA(Gln) amidotransferase subunit GatC [Planctomycetota bacterium]
MRLTVADVQKVAMLARLEFTAEELAAFTDQMGKIVSFVEQLGEVDTDGVAEMAHPLGLHSVVREDEIRPGLTRAEALRGAPADDGECFLVPAVFAAKN